MHLRPAESRRNYASQALRGRVHAPRASHRRHHDRRHRHARDPFDRDADARPTHEPGRPPDLDDLPAGARARHGARQRRARPLRRRHEPARSASICARRRTSTRCTACRFPPRAARRPTGTRRARRNRLVMTFDPADLDVFSNVQLKLLLPNGSDAGSAVDICFSPLGRPFRRLSFTAPFMPMNDVPYRRGEPHRRRRAHAQRAHRAERRIEARAMKSTPGLHGHRGDDRAHACWPSARWASSPCRR